MSNDNEGDVRRLIEEHDSVGVGANGQRSKPRTTLEFERGDHAEVADAIARSLREERYEQLVYDEGSLYGARPPRCLWEQITPERLNVLVHGYAGAPIGEPDRNGKIKPLHVTETLARGARRFACSLHAQPRFFAEAPAGIPFANGFAVLTADGIDLRAHSPEHRARFAYPFDLTNTDDLPEPFLRFCNEVFLPDADRAQKILAIQEHGGACITGLAPKYERAMLLVGPENAGKSRLARFFIAAMPPGTTTALPPSSMGDQYALPILVHSRLNVVPDIGREKITGAVKLIISGEKRQVRNPQHPAFDLWPRAGHLFGVNPPMPQIEDTSGGFERRWIVISHHRQFPDHDPKRDPDIAEKIIASCTPQLVRWFLEGAVRLEKNRRHTLPASHFLALDAWMRRADPVRRFVEHALVRGGGWTRATELLDAFVRWLAGFGERCPFTLRAFVERLNGLGVESRERNDGTHYALVVREGLRHDP